MVQLLPLHLRQSFITTRPKASAEPLFDPEANICHIHKTTCFREHASERIEWVSKVASIAVGSPGIPLRYRGCGPRCLDFLEQLWKLIKGGSCVYMHSNISQPFRTALLGFFDPCKVHWPCFRYFLICSNEPPLSASWMVMAFRFSSGIHSPVIGWG